MTDEINIEIPSEFRGVLHPQYRPPRPHLATVDPTRYIIPGHEDLSRLELRNAAEALHHLRILQAQEDPNAFIEYCFTDETTRGPFQQQWFHEAWQRHWSTHGRSLIIGPRNHGKCLTASAYLETPTGRVQVRDFHGGPVIALNSSTLRMEVALAAAPMPNGDCPVYRVTLASGRSVTVTDNHMFLRGLSWVQCEDLAPGDRVGVMVGCAVHGGSGGDDLEAWMLGFIVGNGSVTRDAGISTTDAQCIERIREYCTARGWVVRAQHRRGDADSTTHHLSAGGSRTGPRQWLREYGLFGCSAYTKMIPSQVLQWGERAIWSFLSGYFDADGGIEANGTQGSFSSVNRALLGDAQALLARCGMNAVLSEKRGHYKRKPHRSWRLTLRGEDLRRFRDGYTGASRKKAALRTTDTGRYGSRQLDLIPFDAWRPHVTITQRQARAAGIRFDSSRDLTKPKLRRLAVACDSAALRAIADGEVAWERVVAIRPVGIRPTYGIEVAGHHNHVTDGIVTHNTSQIVGRTLWEIGKDQDLRIKISCASDGRAKERLYEIKQHIEHNPRVREVFPHLTPESDSEWSMHKIIVRRTARHRDASIEALGINSTATGGRCDLFIPDDVVDRRNALSFPKLRTAIKQAWKSDWSNLLNPEGSRVWYICTLWHKDDLSHELMTNPAYATLRIDVPDDFGALWPARWSSERLYERYLELGSVEFNRGYRNQAIDLETIMVNPAWFRFADLAKDEAFQEAVGRLVIITSYDTMGTPSGSSDQDYASGCVIAVDPARPHLYILDAWHQRMTTKQQAEQIGRDAHRYAPVSIEIEKVGQASVDEWVCNLFPELTSRVRLNKPRVSKAQRLLGVTPLLEMGRVTFAAHLNPNRESWNPGRGSIIHELEDFPFGEKDDIVDAFSQGMAAARAMFLDEWAPGRDPDILAAMASRAEIATGEQVFPF